MSKHLIAALAVVAVLGLAYVFLTPAPRTSDGGPSWEPPHLAGLDGLRVEYPDRHIELRRGPEGWALREPIAFPAARRPVERVERLFGEGGDRLLIVDERPADAASISRHGFEDAAQTLRVTLFAGGEEAATFVVGGTDESASGTVRTWVRGGPDDRLYRLNNDLRAALDRPLDEWRDAEVVAIGSDEREGLRRVELEYGDTRLALVRGEDDEAGDPRWSVEGAGDVAVDSELVARAVARMYTLNAVAFGDGVTPEAAGVATPAARTRLIVAGREPIALELGAPAPSAAGDGDGDGDGDGGGGEAQRYVRRGQTIYVVRESAANNFMPRLGDLRPRDLVEVDRDQVARITLRDADGEEIVLARAEGEDTDSDWVIVAPRGREADDSAIRRVLSGAAHVTAERIAEGEVDAATAGLDAPRRTITVELADATQHVIALGAPVGADGDGAEDTASARRYVRVGDGPIGELRGRGAEHLLQGIDDLSVVEE